MGAVMGSKAGAMPLPTCIDGSWGVKIGVSEGSVKVVCWVLIVVFAGAKGFMLGLAVLLV